MAELDGRTSQINVGATIIPFVSAEYTDERQITDVPPDTTTTGKKTIDTGIYQGTLSLTGNQDIASSNPLETAYIAGGSANVVSISIQPDSGDNSHRDYGSFRIHSFKRGLKVGEIQQWTAELKSTDAISRIRP